MQVCPACGEENLERARFCFSCGVALAETPSAGEERKVVSILFVDLVGFTDRSDRADPEDVRALLRPYHERVKADIERFGGTVEKFIGDAVMAVFGAPVAHEDDAERAVRSALRILETIEELRDEGLEISVRSAVTTGEAVVALGARPERGEGIVTGDVVNTAARLQSAAPVGAVIVDEQTMQSTRSAITFEQLEPIEAKGKSEPVPVWRATQARSLVGQPEAATRTPFVGREHERTLLLETFFRTERESSVQLVTVVGEPGIGKSRLVTELRTALDDRPDVVTWRHGRCLPYGEGITFWALGEIVKSEAGILESDDPVEAATKLDETVATLFADEGERAWSRSRLAPLVGAATDGSTVSREESFTAWGRFLEAIAARGPCVLAVEDLHWADEAMLEFLEHLLEWSTHVPLLLLCSARPELYERRPSWGGGKRNATTISLAPLSTEESGRLLQVLLDRTLLPAETQSVLLDRAGGNPLYAEQFARMLAERGGFEDVTVPETVQALMAARLDTLRPELKTLVHDAAVVGRIFWSGAAAAVGARERDEVRRDLNELVRREFVRPVRVSSLEGEDEFSFWHVLVRDVAYQQIPRSPRADKHLAALAWIESVAGGRLIDHADVLVHHLERALELFRAAGDERPDIAERLADALVLAGDRARQLDAPAAVAAYRRALDLHGTETQRAFTLVKLGDILQDTGEMAEAAQALEEAARVLRDAGEELEAGVALRVLGSVLWRRGDTARSHATTTEAIALLERVPGPELVRAYGSAAMTSALAGRTDDARHWAEAGLRAVDELGLGAESTIRLLMARSSARGYEGDPSGIEDQRAALELSLQAGLGAESSVAHNNLVSWIWALEGPDRANAMIDEAIAFARERGLGQHVQWMRCERMAHLYERGEWQRLLEEGADLVAWARERDSGQIELFALTNTSLVHAHTGRSDEAVRESTRALPRAREVRDPQALLPALTSGAVAYAAAGDRVNSGSLIAETEQEVRELPAIWRTPPPQVVRLCVLLGMIEVAERMLAADPPPVPRNEHDHLSGRAILAEAGERSTEAARLYAEAAEAWGAFGGVVERAYALLGLGRCGDPAAEREGMEIFQWLDAQPLLALPVQTRQQRA